jgi:hypothetical protein
MLGDSPPPVEWRRLKPPALHLLGLAAGAALVLAATPSCPGQPFDNAHTQRTADWISCPQDGARDAGVYRFRKRISVHALPDHVSADNRLILFVNGTRIGDGPARSDLAHWR